MKFLNVCLVVAGFVDRAWPVGRESVVESRSNRYASNYRAWQPTQWKVMRKKGGAWLEDVGTEYFYNTHTHTHTSRGARIEGRNQRILVRLAMKNTYTSLEKSRLIWKENSNQNASTLIVGRFTVTARDVQRWLVEWETASCWSGRQRYL